MDSDSAVIVAALVGGIAGLLGSTLGSWIANRQRGDALAQRLYDRQLDAFDQLLDAIRKASRVLAESVEDEFPKERYYEAAWECFRAIRRHELFLPWPVTDAALDYFETAQSVSDEAAVERWACKLEDLERRVLAEMQRHLRIEEGTHRVSRLLPALRRRAKT
jgi:hypothetical protein